MNYLFDHEFESSTGNVLIVVDVSELRDVYSFAVYSDDIIYHTDQVKDLLYNIPEYFLKMRKEDKWQLKLF